MSENKYPTDEVTKLLNRDTTPVDFENVKVSLLKDVKVDVADIKIDGREGEILTIPRYAAEILENENQCQIQEKDMVVELKQAIVKENVQSEFELSTLEEYFYIRLKSYMKKLPESDYDKVQSMLNSLLRKRHGKIIHLADSSELTAELSNKMTIEEKKFFNKLHETSEEFTKEILGVVENDCN